MTSTTRLIALGVAAGVISASSLAQAGTVQPSRHALINAVHQYLSDHGDLCVGKFSWPRVVTPDDRLARTNDAVQLPVLERLGLVESTELSGPDAATTEPGKRYALTEKGRRYYLQRKRTTLGPHDLPVEHDADLCVARLTLDRLVKWSPPERQHGHLETVVRYTYRIKAADWLADPQVREIFPVVDRIIRNEGNMLMTVTARLQDGKWQPVLPTL